jgi:hypothetical protein
VIDVGSTYGVLVFEGSETFNVGRIKLVAVCKIDGSH